MTGRAEKGVALGLLFCACGSSYQVERLSDGRVTAGRYVPHPAYASYAHAAMLEAKGHLAEAETAYVEALRTDPDSPEVWSRLGAVRCAIGHDETDAAFAHAESLAPELASLWQARAVCALRRQQPRQAVICARRALHWDPTRPENTKLLADALVADGQMREAKALLRALVVANPGMARAERWQQELEGSSPPPPLALIDRALVAGDMEAALRLATAASLSPIELAARAAFLGNPTWALEQAEWVLSADPHNADALLVELCALDLTREEAKLDELLSHALLADVDASPLVSWLFAELLLRRIGPEAARAWAQHTPGGPPHDDLLKRVRSRVRAELGLAAPPTETMHF